MVSLGKYVSQVQNMIIEIDGVSIQIIKKQIKNMTLRIYPPDGMVKVSAPMQYSEHSIRHHIEQKISWIHKQRARMRTRPSPEPLVLHTGSTVPFKGTHFLLIVEEHHGPAQVIVKDHLLLCYIKPDSPPDQVYTQLSRWYRREMESLLPDLIAHWEAIIGVKVAQWGIKHMKTRWGSCNTQAARIWLNLNLIQKPLVCLEYVLVHELIHLLEPSHNKRFYSLMSQFMPQWQSYQNLLEGRLL